MILPSTSDSLEVLLGEVITTTNPTFIADYADLTSPVTTFAASANIGDTNGVTAVTLIAAPAASVQRQAKLINIFNADTVAHVVIVRHNHAGTFRKLISISVPAGYTLQWTTEQGWKLANSPGIANNTLSLASLANATQRAMIAAPSAGSWAEVALSANVYTMLGSADNATIRSNIGAVNIAGDTMTGQLTVSLGATDSIQLGTVQAGRLSLFRTGAATNTVTRVEQYRARNTIASPQVVQSGDQTGRVDSYAYDGSSYILVSNQLITMSEVTPGSGAMASRLTTLLCPVGSAVVSEINRFDHATGFSMYGANVIVDSNRLLNARSFATGSLPAAGTAGRVAFDSTLSRLTWDNGSAWKYCVKLDGDTMTGALQVPAGVVGTPGLQVGTSDTGLWSPATGQLALSNSGVQTFFNSGTQTRIGASLGPASITIGGVAPSLEMGGTTSASATAAISRWSNDAGGCVFYGAKSRSTTVGTPGTAITTNDAILSVGGYGDNGTDITSRGGLQALFSTGDWSVGATRSAGWRWLVRTADTEAELVRFDGVNGISMGSTPAIVIDAARGIRLRSYTLATLPTSVAGLEIYCSDLGGTASGGLLVGDGTGWERTNTGYATNGNSDLSWTYLTNAPSIEFVTTLTANHTVILNATNARKGDRVEIIRTALGAFNLIVQDDASTTLLIMTGATARSAQFVFNGTHFRLAQDSTL